MLCCCLTKGPTPKIQMFCGVINFFFFFLPFVVSFSFLHIFFFFSTKPEKASSFKGRSSLTTDMIQIPEGREEKEIVPKAAVCHHQTVYTNCGGWRGKRGVPVDNVDTWSIGHLQLYSRLHQLFLAFSDAVF